MLFTLLALLASFFPGNDQNEFDQIWKGGSATPQPLATLRVVDWNIDRGTQFEEIAKALDRDHPDLCLLQEVDVFNRRSGDRNVAEALAQRLGLNYAIAPSFRELSQANSEKPAYQGQATLTRLAILSVRVIRFHDQSTWWQPRAFVPNVPLMQRRLGGRTALVTEMKGAHGTIVVYNAHLESRSLGKLQVAQLREILEDARRYPADTPIILAGDFNTKYNAGAVLSILRESGYHSAFGDHAPRTHRIFGNLDWILVRGPAQIDNASVVKSAQGSDHFPVAAKVEVFAPAQTTER